MNIIYVDTRIVDSTQSWLLILPNKPCVINRGSLKSENRRGEQRSHQIHSVGVGKWKFGSWDPWSPNLNMSKHVPILMETVTGCWWGVEVFIFWQKNLRERQKKNALLRSLRAFLALFNFTQFSSGCESQSFGHRGHRWVAQQKSGRGPPLTARWVGFRVTFSLGAITPLKRKMGDA